MADKKVWLITGAGRGLGLDIAKAALDAGHAVVATGRDPADAGRPPPSGRSRIVAELRNRRESFHWLPAF
jgi:NAD(P)-dependent dehydrogenase (short-subunit alcohol dehydrogenase family)